MIPYLYEKQYAVGFPPFGKHHRIKQEKIWPSKTTTAQENVTAVADSIDQSPRRSTRKHAFVFHMYATSVHRILHRSLHMHFYKTKVVQELSERDYETRTN